ncbi:MAG TPA: non-homologous end-joining DNA ligase [Thermoanaerobaculia bacterium]|nr:non-homologous end-joining DNA ligase [Thermoanaerobaculia bacterium]
MVIQAGSLKFIPPMECTAVAELPDDNAIWLYEVKLDGYRCCAVITPPKARLYSRYGNLWSDRFQHIARALAKVDEPMVLDGEIVALDRHGLPNFQELQNWQSTRAPIVFYAFDLLHRGDRDLRRLPIEERKALLEQLPLEDPIRLGLSVDAKLSTVTRRMKKLGLEGIVAKRRGSRYESGKRSKAWLKHRFNQVEEFVIGGYLPEGDNDFSRLLIGIRRGEKLMFVKKLKNGFSAVTRHEVMRAIRKLRTEKNPFANPRDVEPEVLAEAVWVKPKRKVEVEFVEWTEHGRLRHAAFRKLVE